MKAIVANLNPDCIALYISVRTHDLLTCNILFKVTMEHFLGDAHFQQEVTRERETELG